VTVTTLAPAAVVGSQLKTGLGTGSDIALAVAFAAVFIAAAYGILRVLASRVRPLRHIVGQLSVPWSGR
jgi:hypothetical protein